MFARFLVLASLLAFTSCDAVVAPDLDREIRFESDDNDRSIGALETEDGDLIVFGSTGFKGDVAKPAVFPLLLRTSPSGAILDTLVFKSGDYGEIESAGEDGDDVVVVYRTWNRHEFTGRFIESIEPDGRRKRICSLPTPTSWGDARVSRDASRVYTLAGHVLLTWSQSCEELWSVELLGARIIEPVGQIDVAFIRHHTKTFVGLIDSDGNLLFETAVDLDWATGITPIDGGLAVVGVSQDEGAAMLRVVRLSGSGDVLWSRDYVRVEVYLAAIEAIESGGLVFAYHHSPDNEDVGQTVRAHVARLDATGKGLWQRPFGLGDESTIIADFVALRDGRIAIVGHAHPNPLGLSPSNELFDVLVEVLDAS